MNNNSFSISTDLPREAPVRLRLSAVFSDNLVLQREKTPRVWGWASPGARVEVVIAGVMGAAEVSADGTWTVELGRLPDSTGPMEMVIRSGAETRTIRNVLIGEVWVCAGQSNMAWTLRESADGEAEAARATDPALRFFITGFSAPDRPAEDCEGRWVECSPETAAGFSGVAYFFGRKLRGELKTPVGLILSAQGATAGECWMSREALGSDAVLKPIVGGLATRLIDPKGWDLHLPSGLFNGRIAPLARLRIRGFIWYQGETNAKRAWQYRTLFPLLIGDWRKWWGEELPFYFVQIANYGKPPEQPVDETWAELREAQTRALALPNTGMAVAIDVGEAANVHPKNKQDVGARLAALALSRTYRRKGTDSGPLYRGWRLDGNVIRVAFDSIGAGLEGKGGALRQFSIAGEDRVFVWADAVIDGNEVTVSSPAVSRPVAVRYAWAGNPAGCNLYNQDGFPASPFRTDDWPGVTDTAHWVESPRVAERPVMDAQPGPSVLMTGNTLEVDLTATVERSWSQVIANGYRYGPRQKKEADGGVTVWLPYGNERGLYQELSGMTLTPTQPGCPASLVYEGGGHSGQLGFKFAFSAAISGFRLWCGPVEFETEDAVAEIDYSTDGSRWTVLHALAQSGAFSTWGEAEGMAADGVNTRELYLRWRVRGKHSSEIVSPRTRLKVRMAGDVMWGDADSTFTQAQWRLSISAQVNPVRPTTAFPLWDGAPPGARGADPDKDIPTLTPYWPQGAGSGAAVIICPGGGYMELMDGFEGRDYALWLNERGIAAFVLKYRLASAGYRHPVITGDLQRAIRLVRASAASWRLDAARIGVMGSSAGGHLASYALVHHDAGDATAADPVEAVSSRPDLGVLCYAVISSSLSTMRNLLGENPSRELRDWVSSELHVNSTTPPCFVWHTLGDKTVTAEHSRLWVDALRAKGARHEAHIYMEGDHSIALGVHGYQPGTGQSLHAWTFELDRWLGALGWRANAGR